MRPLRRASITGVFVLAITAMLLSGCSAADSSSTTSSPATSASSANTPAARTPSASPSSTRTPITTPSTSSTPSAQNVNGRWCPTKTDAERGCVLIKLPNATYDDGTTVNITAHDSPWNRGQGVFEYAMADAPFGTYYPAEVPLKDYDGSAGEDPTRQDRIWNSQTQILYLRASASTPTTTPAQRASDQPGADGSCGPLKGAGTKYLQGRLYVTSGTIGCNEANAILNGYLMGPVEGSGHIGTFKGFECGRDNRSTAEVKAECEKGGTKLEVRQ